eukprot:scaffold670_cov333-Pavlova_lutheri.AAC.24
MRVPQDGYGTFGVALLNHVHACNVVHGPSRGVVNQLFDAPVTGQKVEGGPIVQIVLLIHHEVLQLLHCSPAPRCGRLTGWYLKLLLEVRAQRSSVTRANEAKGDLLEPRTGNLTASRPKRGCSFEVLLCKRLLSLLVVNRVLLALGPTVLYGQVPLLPSEVDFPHVLSLVVQDDFENRAFVEGVDRPGRFVPDKRNQTLVEVLVEDQFFADPVEGEYTVLVQQQVVKLGHCSRDGGLGRSFFLVCLIAQEGIRDELLIGDERFDRSPSRLPFAFAYSKPSAVQPVSGEPDQPVRGLVLGEVHVQFRVRCSVHHQFPWHLHKVLFPGEHLFERGSPLEHVQARAGDDDGADLFSIVEGLEVDAFYVAGMSAQRPDQFDGDFFLPGRCMGVPTPSRILHHALVDRPSGGSHHEVRACTPSHRFSIPRHGSHHLSFEPRQCTRSFRFGVADVVRGWVPSFLVAGHHGVHAGWIAEHPPHAGGRRPHVLRGRFRLVSQVVARECATCGAEEDGVRSCGQAGGGPVSSRGASIQRCHRRSSPRTERTRHLRPRRRRRDRFARQRPISASVHAVHPVPTLACLRSCSHKNTSGSPLGGSCPGLRDRPWGCTSVPSGWFVPINPGGRICSPSHTHGSEGKVPERAPRDGTTRVHHGQGWWHGVHGTVALPRPDPCARFEGQEGKGRTSVEAWRCAMDP